MKTKTKEKNVFEYEDYGTPSMYLFAILSIILMIGMTICFGMIFAAICVLIGGVING